MKKPRKPSAKRAKKPSWRSRYVAHLRSPQWKEFRASVIAARGGRCERCRAAGTLHVHHVTYERLGFELPQDVLLLCVSCHAAEHPKNKRLAAKLPTPLFGTTLGQRRGGSRGLRGTRNPFAALIPKDLH